MTFTCNGKTYNTDELLTFETKDPDTPVIYMTREYDCVFVTHMHPWKGVEVRQADSAEIESLANRFNLPHLRRALSPPGE